MLEKYQKINIHLSRIVETLPDDSIDEDPGEQEETKEVGLNTTNLLNAITHMEHLVAEIKYLSFTSSNSVL